MFKPAAATLLAAAALLVLCCLPSAAAWEGRGTFYGAWPWRGWRATRVQRSSLNKFKFVSLRSQRPHTQGLTLTHAACSLCVMPPCTPHRRQ
jgi:hypothetical protein